MNCTPPLFCNRFASLPIEFTDRTNSSHSKHGSTDVLSKPPFPPRIPKWEHELPKRFVLASTPSSDSLLLDVALQTADTGENFATPALLDCGASGLFMDTQFVARNELATRPLSRPFPVYNVDGTLNEAGSIHRVVDATLHYNGHSERAIFAVTGLGKQNVILGLSWLRKHNPEVDWRSGEVKMSRCPAHCRTCFLEGRQERRRMKKVLEKVADCREGPLPEVNIRAVTMEEVPDEDAEVDDMPELAEDPDEEDDEDDEVKFEDGDRLFATTIPPEAEFIRATSNVSQRLAEAHAKYDVKETRNFRDMVPEHLHEFEDIFSKTSFDTLPKRRVWDHAIELVADATPTNCKVYPLAPNEQDELDAFLRENLATGRIRPSKSPMASPVFFIKKKDGTLRLIQDYRALNAMSIKNRYPLPLISELIGQLRGARYFTKLDVRWGYNNVRMKGGDEWKAAFRTNRGLFEPLVMFFGLTNSPATFQTMMNEIFQDLVMEGVVCVYIDDILIFTKTLEEHRRVTRMVLDRLREHKLYLKPEKCEFEKTRIEYLGVIISHGQVEMDPVKIAGVAQWPEPRKRKELQSFLGFANFYRRFIRDFSRHARPLFNLTKKDVKWSWGAEEQKAFDGIKMAVTSAPILRFPDDDEPFHIEADSSDFATGAVLSQRSKEDGNYHPVAYYSKSLTAVERNYEIHDKEMLAIIRALEEWRHFLEGARQRFDIWTDHKNLEYFTTAKRLNRRQARWSLYLSRFDFALHHRPGSTMGKSDALSRRPDHGDGSGDNQNLVLLRPEFFAVRAMEGVAFEGEEQEVMREIRRRVRHGQVEDAVAKAVKAMGGAGSRTLRGAEWRMADGILYFRDHIYVPDDPGLRRRIVAQHHDTKVAGHPGRWKTLELVSRSYWWPHMSRFVGGYCRACDLCLRTKVQRRKPIGELHPLPVPEERWDVVSLDFIVELPDAHGHDACLVVVESVGKMGHMVPTVTTVTAAGTARLYFANVWKLHGLPRVVVCDRGAQFVAEFMRELSNLVGVKIANSTAYHPQTDGQTERVNQELEQYVRLFTNERQDDWDDLLPLFEFAYNNHVHSSTKQVPFYVETGRLPRMGFEPDLPRSKVEAVNEFADRMKGALDEARAALAHAKDDMARYYNQRHDPAPVFKAGDKVYLDASDIKTTRPSRKLSHRNLGPFPVVRPVGSHAYRLRLPPSMSRLHPVFHVVKLTPVPHDPIGRKIRAPPPPTVVDGELEYEVEEVLDSRVRYRRLEFLVRWKGYGYEENSWVAERDVHAGELVADFYRRHPGAPRRIRTLVFGRFPWTPHRDAAAWRGGDVRGTPLPYGTPRTPTMRTTYRDTNAQHIATYRDNTRQCATRIANAHATPRVAFQRIPSRT